MKILHKLTFNLFKPSPRRINKILPPPDFDKVRQQMAEHRNKSTDAQISYLRANIAECRKLMTLGGISSIGFEEKIKDFEEELNFLESTK